MTLTPQDQETLDALGFYWLRLPACPLTEAIHDAVTSQMRFPWQGAVEKIIEVRIGEQRKSALLYPAFDSGGMILVTMPWLMEHLEEPLRTMLLAEQWEAK